MPHHMTSDPPGRTLWLLLSACFASPHLSGCADVLGIGDKQVVSDEQYDHYLETGEIVPSSEISQRDSGAGGTSTGSVFDEAPAGTDAPGAGGSTSGGPAGGGTGFQASPHIDLYAYDSFAFYDGYLTTTTLRGHLFTDGLGVDFSPTFFDTPSAPPYCVDGTFDPGFADTPNVLLMGIGLDATGADGWLPGREGLLVDYTATEGVELQLQLVSTNGDNWCARVETEGPAFVPWGAFQDGCFHEAAPTAYDRVTPIQAIALTVISSAPDPLDFGLCFFGMVEY